MVDCEKPTHSHTPTRHIWTLGQDPLASFLDALGIPLSSFFNVQGSPIDFYSSLNRSL